MIPLAIVKTPEGNGKLFQFSHGVTGHIAIVLIGKKFHAFPLHDIELVSLIV